MSDAFELEAFTDYLDDVLTAQMPIGPVEIDSMMAALQELGVSRIHWSHYNDARGGWMVPDRPSDAIWKEWDGYLQMMKRVPHPLKTVVAAARRHGLDVYAYFKPYEQGISLAFPEGSPDARNYPGVPSTLGPLPCVTPFMYQNPDCRVRRRSGDLPPDLDVIPINAVELIKSDDRPTRITLDHLRFWESDDNYTYRPVVTAGLTMTQTIRPAADETADIDDRIVTRRGDPVRVLTVSGLDVQTKYLVVTTDFTAGPPDFENTALRLLSVFGPEGRPIPGVFGSLVQIWGQGPRDFRSNGLPFDEGWGCVRIFLDEPTGPHNRGVVGFCRGRNLTLPLAPCETDPRVVAYWLECVQDMIDAGVSGVDFRVANHCSHTDFPEEYGYNDCVLERCQAQNLPVTPQTVARIRGEAYTDFLRQCRTLLKRHGLAMRAHLHLDAFRPRIHPKRRLAYPGLIDYEWRKWLDEGLLDAATLRSWAQPYSTLEQDPVTIEMIEHCQARGVPIYLERYLHPGHQDVLPYPDQYERARRDGRFAGFVLYETYDILQLAAAGRWRLKNEEAERWLMAIRRSQLGAATGPELHHLDQAQSALPTQGDGATGD